MSQEAITYLGDNLLDIPFGMSRRSGSLRASGVEELKTICHYTTKRVGGRGVAREVTELILRARGRWEQAIPLALASFLLELPI